MKIENNENYVKDEVDTSSPKNEESQETGKWGFVKVNVLRAILVFVVGSIGLSIIFTLVVILGNLFGVNVPKITEDAAGYYKINSTYQLIAYLLLFISIIFAVISPNLVERLKKVFKGYDKASSYVKGIYFGIALLVWQIAYNVITTMIFGSVGSNDNQSSLVEMAKGNFFSIFVVSVILAPVCEELTYRFALFGGIASLGKSEKGKKIMPIIALIVTAVVFGLIHFDFGAVKAHLTSPTEETLQALKVELINLPNYIGAGIILSLAYYYNDSIVSSWMAHTLNNLWSMIGVAQLIMGGNE